MTSAGSDGLGQEAGTQPSAELHDCALKAISGWALGAAQQTPDFCTETAAVPGTTWIPHFSSNGGCI